jgi:hypothetical protein
MGMCHMHPFDRSKALGCQKLIQHLRIAICRWSFVMVWKSSVGYVASLDPMGDPISLHCSLMRASYNELMPPCPSYQYNRGKTLH